MRPSSAGLPEMSSERRRITVELEAATGGANGWTSDVLLISGAHVERILSAGGEDGGSFTVQDGIICAESDIIPPLCAVVSLPADLQSKAQEETEKLNFERAKFGLEEKWKRRTFLWTIASALLTAGVAVAVALIGVSGGSKDGSTLTVASGPVQSCRDSLKRLTTLADVSGQTVPALGEAISRHEETCDEILVDVLAEIGR